jgi:hypothetical protein
MVVSWDGSDNHLWFGAWGEAGATTAQPLVAEPLPESSCWDLAVWRRDRPTVLARGVALSAAEATAAAETAAARLRTRMLVPGD